MDEQQSLEQQESQAISEQEQDSQFSIVDSNDESDYVYCLLYPEAGMESGPGL